MNQVNLYAELGNVQFQLDKLNEIKVNIIRQIEMQMTINSIKEKEQSEALPDPSMEDITEPDQQPQS